jgi:hypothetical protein
MAEINRNSEAQRRDMVVRWARRTLSSVEGPLGLRLRMIAQVRPEPPAANGAS